MPWTISPCPAVGSRPERARRLGRDASTAAALQGWPALVRLAFAAGPSAPWRYAREEILGRLPGPQCRALAALGSATASEVAAVTGGPVALDDLVHRIPLVGVLDDGRYRAHDLWTDAVSRTLTAQETQTLRARAVATLVARGDLARAGRLACQARDWRLLADLAVELVHTTLTALPRGIAERWLDAVPPGVADEPAFVLLGAAVMHARDFTDPRIDPMLDRAWRGMLVLDDEAGATATLGQAVITAHSRADLTRLATLTGRADPSSPVLRLLWHTVAAMHAEVAGDPEAALTHLRPGARARGAESAGADHVAVSLPLPEHVRSQRGGGGAGRPDPGRRERRPRPAVRRRGALARR